MDIIIFLIAFLCLLQKKYDWVLFFIVLLTSVYFQMRLPIELVRPTFPFYHHVSDTGLFLYSIMYLQILASKNHIISVFSRETLGIWIFFGYLLLSSIIDYSRDVPMGDIIYLLRPFLLLTVVFIKDSFSYDTCVSVMKKVYYLTIIISADILIEGFTGVELLPFIEITGRGVKSPIYAIFCAFLATVNFFGHTRGTQIIYLVILLLPILLIAKMTYIISAFLIYGIYLVVRNGTNVGKIVASMVALMFAVNILVFLFPGMVGRIEDLQNNIANVKDVEYGDNSTFRLAHAFERLTYVLNGGWYEYFRGVGFISESHFKGNIFTVGLISNEGGIIQLDTGDIAWSLFFVRYGIVGTFIFIMMVVTLVRNLFSSSELGKYFSYWLIVAISFQSFGNSVPFDAFFYFLPILFINKFDIEYEKNIACNF